MRHGAFLVAGELRRDFSTALGASETSLIELTSAFAPFANGGNGVLPYAIVEIKDSNGRVLYRRAGTGPGQVVQPGPLADMTDMLTAVVQRGTGRAAQLDRPVGGKTGTSQDFRDAWFVGYTADYIAGVWMGNDDGAPMDRVTGGSLPARTWRTFMIEAHKGLPVRDFAATPVSAGGFDFNRLIDSLFRGDRGSAPPPDSPAPARQRLTPNDPANRPGVPLAWLMDAYGLTPAEARVALAASSGLTIPEVARQLNLSPNTIKTHLRKVFAKTGTNRQMELARLVASIGLLKATGSDGKDQF